jgi:hydroxymethylbilane synthase
MATASPPQTQPLRIGSRNSQLALIQANHAASLLSAAHRGLKTEIRTAMVRGDADKTTPFLLMAEKINQEGAKQQQSNNQSQTVSNGQDKPSKQENMKTTASDAAKSLWTEEMEIMLGQGELDLLVHCLKDMPTALPDHCTLGAVLEREDPTDAVVMKLGYTGPGGLEDLPDGSVVGTSSTRRKALLKRLYPNLVVR